MSYIDTITDTDIDSLRRKNEMLQDLLERRAIRNVMIDIACEWLAQDGVSFDEPKDAYIALRKAAKERGFGKSTYEKSKTAEQEG